MNHGNFRNALKTFVLFGGVATRSGHAQEVLRPWEETPLKGSTFAGGGGSVN